MKWENWFRLKEVSLREDDPLPNVDECLVRALGELSHGTNEGTVNAAIFLTTASRCLEREAFQMLCRAIDLDGSDTITTPFIQDRMEAVFVHVLEALSRIVLSGVTEDAYTKEEQLREAGEYTVIAQSRWLQLHQISLQKAPKEMQ